MAKIKTLKPKSKKTLGGKPLEENRNKTVYFRLTEAEWAKVCAAAAKVKMSPHGFCRWDMLMRLG